MKGNKTKFPYFFSVFTQFTHKKVKNKINISRFRKWQYKRNYHFN